MRKTCVHLLLKKSVSGCLPIERKGTRCQLHLSWVPQAWWWSNRAVADIFVLLHLETRHHYNWLEKTGHNQLNKRAAEQIVTTNKAFLRGLCQRRRLQVQFHYLTGLPWPLTPSKPFHLPKSGPSLHLHHLTSRVEEACNYTTPWSVGRLLCGQPLLAISHRLDFPATTYSQQAQWSLQSLLIHYCQAHNSVNICSNISFLPSAWHHSLCSYNSMWWDCMKRVFSLTSIKLSSAARKCFVNRSHLNWESFFYLV